MPLEVVSRSRRRCVFDVTISDADGDNVPIAAGDVIRAKIGRPGETPKLDLDSAAASVNGSTVSSANPSTITIVSADQADFRPGNWTLEIDVYDASQSDILFADAGPFTILDTQLGDVGAV